MRKREYRSNRREAPREWEQLQSCCKENGAGWLSKVLAEERPVFYGQDRLGFHRSIRFVSQDWGGNVTPNYSRVITQGFDKIIEEIKRQQPQNEEQRQFAHEMISSLQAGIAFAERYRVQALQEGHTELAKALETVPRRGAETFHQACVFLKLCIYLLRYDHVCHVTLGRFDQYMLPFFLADQKRGVPDEELFELLEEFFISLNFDTDLYTGIQQGDNGQSMVLGGFDEQGNNMYHRLSQFCMDASRELKLIDPKINLRVGKNTPPSLFKAATMLTKEGLGFPQYCNDDVVVPGLVKLGYDKKDALDYTVAACWEYIIPGLGADVPNLKTMDFPHVISDTLHRCLMAAPTFSDLMEQVQKAIGAECQRLIKEAEGASWGIHPLLSVFFDGCIQNLTGLFQGGTKYLNFGCHGAGISNGADALAAVKQVIYDDKAVSKEELLDALDHNFEGNIPLRNLLRSCPKMGSNEDEVDQIACQLMKAFSHHLNGQSNGRGGIWRAGTGSAMDYISKGKACPATADGRLAGEPYASSFSPSLDVKTAGLLSVIQSFTKYDLTEIINGGPLTIEIHDTVFRTEDGITKTAALVKEFILLGGHQLQINSINRDQLLDAQKHPEQHPNLIVRVWGWSGYFNELDIEYQNHIIARTEYTV